MKNFFRLTAVLMTCLAIFMSTSVFATSDVNQFPLEKTGTTYELIDIFFSSAVGIDGKDGLRSVEKKIPEFHVRSFDTDSKRIASGQLEVRFASEFTVSKEDAKAFGSAYFSEAINDMVSLAAKHEFTIPPDLDDSDFQFFVKSQALEISDPDVIQLIKFIDIYENYEHNLKMKELVSTLENTVFSSTTDFVKDGSLKELLSMMPVAGVSTAEAAPSQSVAEATESTHDHMWSRGTEIDFANLVSQYLSSVDAAQVGWNPVLTLQMVSISFTVVVTHLILGVVQAISTVHWGP